MKTVKLEGDLMSYGPQKEWFKLGFRHDLGYFHMKKLYKFAVIYEDQDEDSFYVALIKNVEWALTWTEGEEYPDTILLVTFENLDKKPFKLHEKVRFYFEEEGTEVKADFYLEA